jgi:hypothetical protein
MRRSRKRTGAGAYDGLTPVLVCNDDISIIEDMVNDEAQQVIHATNSMPIFFKNVDHSGWPDTQCLVEEMMENYYEDFDPNISRKLYERNLHKSLMRDFHQQHPNTKPDKIKTLMEEFSSSFLVLAKWEGSFRFLFRGDYNRIVPTIEEVATGFGCEESTEGEEELLDEFALIRPSLSQFVQWLAPGGSREDEEVAKPKKKKKTLNQEACSTAKKAKTAECPVVIKGYHVGGEWKTRYQPGFWGRMSEDEKMEYRAQRNERGNWPGDIPRCEQWIKSKGQLFKTMFRTKI